MSRKKKAIDRENSGSEDFADRSVCYAKEQFEQLLEQTEEYVRENPTRAIAYAAAAGIVLDRLPVGRILSGVARLAVIAIKPAVIIYGATRLYQAIQQDEE